MLHVESAWKLSNQKQIPVNKDLEYSVRRIYRIIYNGN